MTKAHFLPASFLAGAALLAVLAGPVGAVDFIRGDSNSDGQVTISDAHHIASWLFRGQVPAECLAAMNVDGGARTDISDAIQILTLVVPGGTPPAAPFPSPGPGGEGETCEAYGNGLPLADPAARLEVRAEPAPGGASGRHRITVLASSSNAIAGYSGTVRVDPAVIAGTTSSEGSDLSGTSSRHGFNKVGFEDDSLYFGFLSTLSGNGPWIPAGEGVAVLEFEVCLRAGATAGEYPLELTGGELIDAGSGRAIAPDLVSGTLVLAADLDPGVGAEVGWTDCYPPVIDGPEDVNARFEVGGGTAVPGETVTLPFIIRANDDVQGYSVSLDFDEEVIEAVGVDTVFEKPDGSEYGFVFHEFDNANATPGSGGVDEGFFIGAAVFSLEDNRNLMPRDQDNTALALTVRVKPETEASSTEFRILDGAQGSGDAVPNAVTIRGMTVIPENAGSFVLIDGVLNVLPEITAFIRGDSNGDQVLNITDPQATLSYLFRGARRPACYDAADANDDGELNIVDPIATLMHLFAGAGNLPAPFPAAGEDPTGDRLRCSSIVSE